MTALCFVSTSRTVAIKRGSFGSCSIMGCLAFGSAATNSITLDGVIVWYDTGGLFDVTGDEVGPCGASAGWPDCSDVPPITNEDK